MSNYALIPGMESFMEDTDVEVEVNVGAPEVAEEVAETVEASDGVAEEEAEAEETEEQVEMINRRYDEIERMMAHVEKYGVDRTFLSLMDHNGALSRGLNITLPSCESFDTMGSPMSAESIACMEGFKDAMKSVWEWLKKVAAKIGNYLSRFFGWIADLFRSVDSQIGRLRKIMKERTLDSEKLKDAKAKVYTFAELDKIRKAVDKKPLFTEISDCVSTLTNTLTVIYELAADASTDSSKFKLEEQDTLSDKKLKALKEKFDKWEKDKKSHDSASEQSLDKITEAECTKLLDLATECRRTLDVAEHSRKALERMVNDVKALGNKMQTRSGDSGVHAVTTAARKVGGQLSTLGRYTTKLLSDAAWIAKQAVRTVSVVYARGSKKN